MKKSKKVSLIVLGTAAALAGCDDVGQQTSLEEVRQEFYKTREDCQHDWGEDSRDCTPAEPTQIAGNTTSSGGGHGYYGPRYYWDRSAGYPVAVEPNGETRPLKNSYLSRSTSSMAHSTRSFGQISVTHGGGHSTVARGGFGGTARGFSGGG